MNRKLNILKKVFVLCVVFCMIVTLTACGDDNEEKTETTEEIKNGEVASPEEFKKLGLYIDVKSSYIKDVKYSIEDNEIAVISFVYNGIDCQFRGSCTYEDYDLAKVMNTSTGDMLSTTLKGYGATYYTLVPGRIVFWDAGHVNYSFYTFVTASDEVVKEILECLVFEDHYDERADVKQQTEDEGVIYARQIVTVFENKDIDTLADMMYYPQMLGNGESVANREEFFNINQDELFTDILLKALSDDAIDNIRTTEDGEEYIIGTNYKNVHFRKKEDGKFKIVKINN